jgi:FixJ family two-component response regulator
VLVLDAQGLDGSGERLSYVEKEVSDEVAAALGISAKTAERKRAVLMRNLGMNSVMELVH